ncbi:hypothetical protein PR048_021443 [Dryococelus australis]|uniref:Uncharacterized protein n=1 Tax=Dryococelus australis TaxID=614101 RepID=A0ABQ9GY74_9NEOP|nr:hypothetical protein PR048_021443 [Dryococelus australis]
MHKLYLEKYGDQVSYSFSWSFYEENFNYRFGWPQVDTYCTCEELKLKIKSPHLNEVATRTVVAELMVLTLRSKKFYSALQFEQSQEAKKEGNVISLSFYFMQNILLPELTVDVFCIMDIKARTSSFYVYHKGEGRKSPNEVCLFLHDYVKQVPAQITELRIFSDNCAAQNKNQAFIRGHSFLPCNREFGVISKRLRKHDRHSSIYKIIEHIIKSSSQGKFIAKKQTYYKKNTTSEERKHKPRGERVTFGISSFYHFVYSHDMKGYTTAHATINGLIPHTFFMLLGNGLIVHPDRLTYKGGKVLIKASKLTDLQKVLKYVPSEHIEFYDFWVASG